MKRIQALVLIMIPSLAFGQDQDYVGFVEEYKMEIVLLLVVLATIVALMAALISYFALRAIIKPESADTTAKQGFWERFYTNFNKTAPEAVVITDHEYDGIRELDNKLPPWWLYGFYFTIAFGVVYLIHFHVLGTGPSSAEEYVAEMERAEEQVAAFLATQDLLIDETNVELLTADADLIAGKDMYIQNCVACHGTQGEGGIGPNFADKYWIHGGDVKSLFSVIKYGVPTKGMISWQNQFNPLQMAQLSSYILSFQGTDPPNPKEPQGELYEPAAEDASEEPEGGEEPVTL